jgi:hypothetical protein
VDTRAASVLVNRWIQVKRSAPCQETWSRRDGERWSLNQASETRGLGRDMAMTISVLAGDHPV